MASNLTGSSVFERAWYNPAVFGARRMFYVCSPSETSFQTIKDVPEYVNKAVPYFFVMVLLEHILLYVQNQKSKQMRANDSFSSIAAGTISLFPMLFVRNIEMTGYIWLHSKFTILVLPWDSPWTWWLCMLGVDCGYYWVHRFAHEVNFMWAAHQVHHSSEDYNLSTALRQSILQRYSSWVFYLPLALFIPPQVFMVHVQLNLIYQFWIHTECVSRLGPLEWILNTPSHHRVHHGRNRYCIDKNYAGVLIVWDRMFGTFEAEKVDDKVVYGLVHPLNSWNPIYTQYCHWKYIVTKALTDKSGFMDKVSLFVKGPGWEPGKPRTGLIEDLPDIRAPQPKYDSTSSTWLSVYAWVHFVLVLAGHQLLIDKKNDYPMLTVFLGMLYLLWTLSNIGYIFEKRWYAAYSELVRCVVYILVDLRVCLLSAACPPLLSAPRAVFYLSVVLCSFMPRHDGTGRHKPAKAVRNGAGKLRKKRM